DAYVGEARRPQQCRAVGAQLEQRCERRHIDVAGAVNADAGGAGVEAGGVRYDGIDDQWSRAVIRTDLEGDVPPAQTKPAVDARATARRLLVDKRSVQAQRLAACGDDHVGTVELDRVRAGDLEADLPRIGAGGDDEVELRGAMRAVEHEIGAGVNAAIDDAPIRRHIAQPRGG